MMKKVDKGSQRYTCQESRHEKDWCTTTVTWGLCLFFWGGITKISIIKNYVPTRRKWWNWGFWEENVHIIVSIIGDNGVAYKVKQEDEDNSRMLHRNTIMKIDECWKILIVTSASKAKQKSKSPKTSNRKKMVLRTDINEETANIPCNPHQTIYTCYLTIQSSNSP